MMKKFFQSKEALFLAVILGMALMYGWLALNGQIVALAG